ncbi:hypothetical protein EDD18DRAFT_167949 [Armillaria luteobubalina]|uniref:Uncharacterized protein n=1 Tax=Armillaria luteobubalina TaxID=153913 RepID=A0AA39P2R2_9AGAR|nr:hypothetical protein EDD18DRAFT_167949 [Armillaria luteobubalina]
MLVDCLIESGILIGDPCQQHVEVNDQSHDELLILCHSVPDDEWTSSGSPSVLFIHISTSSPSRSFLLDATVTTRLLCISKMMRGPNSSVLMLFPRDSGTFLRSYLTMSSMGHGAVFVGSYYRFRKTTRMGMHSEENDARAVYRLRLRRVSIESLKRGLYKRSSSLSQSFNSLVMSSTLPLP